MEVTLSPSPTSLQNKGQEIILNKSGRWAHVTGILGNSASLVVFQAAAKAFSPRSDEGKSLDGWIISRMFTLLAYRVQERPLS